MLVGFEDLLLRGNIVDLAVAVVIGTEFGAIVTAFGEGITDPLLAVFGGANEIGLGFRLVADNPATLVAIGPIITAAIYFARERGHCLLRSCAARDAYTEAPRWCDGGAARRYRTARAGPICLPRAGRARPGVTNSESAQRVRHEERARHHW